MEIIIKNISPLPQAKIIFEGLTVIAGENDTGKSTLGKLIFSLIKADNMATANQPRQQLMNTMINLVFDSQISNDGKVIVQDKGVPIYSIKFSQNQCSSFEFQATNFSLKETTFIQTPFVWDLIDFFDSVLRLKQNQELTQNISPFSFKYPYLFWDVYIKITNTPIKNSLKTNKLVKNIQNLIQGSFEQHNQKIVFQRQKESILLMNVAAGIKYFGLLQRLAENNQLNSNHVLIFDEPENHLHPEWQLLLAHLLVDLVNQHKVYVLVNSHSPYMIEALKIYSDRNIKEKTHFYLNQLTDMGIKVNEVTNDLSIVFEKLSLPFQKLEQTASSFWCR